MLKTGPFVLAGFMALASLGMVGGNASASTGGAPCGDVTFDYFPNVIAAGQAMDMDLSVENCSGIRERIYLQVRWRGPCDFFHPERHAYDLEGGHGFAMSILMLAPDFPGSYRADVRITAQGNILDRDRSGFTVNPALDSRRVAARMIEAGALRVRPQAPPGGGA